MSRPLSDDRDTATTVCDVTHWEMFEYSVWQFHKKPLGTLPHFSLLLPVAVELPHYYVWVFLVIGAP